MHPDIIYIAPQHRAYWHRTHKKRRLMGMVPLQNEISFCNTFLPHVRYLQPRSANVPWRRSPASAALDNYDNMLSLPTAEAGDLRHCELYSHNDASRGYRQTVADARLTSECWHLGILEYFARKHLGILEYSARKHLGILEHLARKHLGILEYFTQKHLGILELIFIFA